MPSIRVRSSFQYLVNSWTTIVELMSIYKRLRGLDALGPRRAPARHRQTLPRTAGETSYRATVARFGHSPPGVGRLICVTGAPQLALVSCVSIPPVDSVNDRHGRISGLLH